MNRFLKTSVLSLAVAATSLTALPAAQAGDYHRRHRDGDLAVAGLAGLAAGALIVGLAQQPRAPEPIYVDPGYEPDYGGPVYVEPVRPRPYYAARPRPVRDYGVEYRRPAPRYTQYQSTYEPWSREWYRYCTQRYRSFDPETGTYNTGSERRFCVAN